MTKLTDLDGTFVRHASGGNFLEVESLSEADGVMFDCPGCGDHSIVVWDRSVPIGDGFGAWRWTMDGTSLSDLTLHPSVDLSHSGIACKWHGWVKNGDAA